MWFPEECDNLDSCSEGARHLYPDPGTTVEVLEAYECRIVGAGPSVILPPGTYNVGPHVDHQGHQASLIFGELLVWLDIVDIHAEGWKLHESGIMSRNL